MSFADRKEAIGAPVHWLHTWPQRYGFAFMAVTLAAALRYGLHAVLGLAPLFIFFYPTIMLIALQNGLAPGVFATLLSATITDYCFVEPLNSFSIRDSRVVGELALFVVVGITISCLGDLFRQRATRLREFEKAVEGLEEMITVVDRDYRYVIANRAFLNYRGMRREDLIGSSIQEVLYPEAFETIKEKLDESFRGKSVEYEMRYSYPKRGERDLFISYFPIEGQGGIERVACVLQDITDQKEAEQALKLFRALIDQSHDAVEVVDPETLRFLDVNETACKDLGYTREELLAMTVFDVNPKLDESGRTSVQRKLRESGFVVHEAVHQRKDGSTFPVEISLKLVDLDRSYIIALSRDITDRKRAEQALRESEDRYRDLVEHSEDLVCTHDLEGRLLSANPAAARMLGYELAELLQIPMMQLIAPDHRNQFGGYLERIKNTGSDRGLLSVVTRSGEQRIWEYNNTLRTEGVTAPIVRGMARDITERMKVEEALRRREGDYRRFVAQSSEGIFREDLDVPISIDLPEDELIHHIVSDSYMAECNDAMARMYGFTSGTELVGKRLTEMLVADDPRNFELAREYVRSGFQVLERESREGISMGTRRYFETA